MCSLQAHTYLGTKQLTSLSREELQLDTPRSWMGCEGITLCLSLATAVGPVIAAEKVVLTSELDLAYLPPYTSYTAVRPLMR